MSTIGLEQETLTPLPMRYETRRWGRGGGSFGINLAALAQENNSVQVMEGCVVGCVQNSVQINIGLIFQR